MNKLPFFVFNALTRNFRLLLRHNIERMDLNQDWSEFTEYVNAQAGVKGTAFLEANAHAGSQGLSLKLQNIVTETMFYNNNNNLFTQKNSIIIVCPANSHKLIQASRSVLRSLGACFRRLRAHMKLTCMNLSISTRPK